MAKLILLVLLPVFVALLAGAQTYPNCPLTGMPPTMNSVPPRAACLPRTCPAAATALISGKLGTKLCLAALAPPDFRLHYLCILAYLQIFSGVFHGKLVLISCAMCSQVRPGGSVSERLWYHLQHHARGLPVDSRKEWRRAGDALLMPCTSTALLFTDKVCW